MTTEELEVALKQTADAARPPRSVVGDVMSRIETVACPEWGRVPGRSRHVRRMVVGLVSAAAVVAVAVTLVVVLLGTGASVTLADVKTALAGKTLIHVRYDGGQVKEQWMDLQSGRSAYVRFDGGAGIIDAADHSMVRYHALSGVATREADVVYPEGQKAPPYVPRTAYEAIVAPLEERAKPAEGQPAVERHADALDGRAMVRFDLYGPDGLGHRMLFTQLWVDQETHLPVRSRNRLQLGERPESGGREWAVGTYDFGVPVPMSLADLGVPKGTAVVDRLNSKPVAEDLAKLVAAAKAARDAFPADYRDVVWRDNEVEVDVIYRQGVKRAQSRYFNIRDNGMDKEGKYSIATPLTADRILEWVPSQTAINVSVYDGQREYDRRNPVPYLSGEQPPASVHVLQPHGRPLLNSSDWPEEILWPTGVVSGGGRNLEYLGKTDDAPAGTVGVRFGGQGTQRHDFYLDPSKRHACVKWVWWEKRDGEWRRTREYFLADLRSVKGFPVPTTRVMVDYGDESRRISRHLVVEHHEVRAMEAADYPADIFNGEKLLEGAKVEPF